MSFPLRCLFIVGLMSTAVTAEAASVKNFVVKCVHREELSADDIYLDALHDGRPVSWGKENQPGTSAAKPFEMKENSVLALDEASLAKMTFRDSLQVAVKNKDVGSDQTVCTVTLMPNDGSNILAFKTKDYEYKVEYIVAP